MPRTTRDTQFTRRRNRTLYPPTEAILLLQGNSLMDQMGSLAEASFATEAPRPSLSVNSLTDAIAGRALPWLEQPNADIYVIPRANWKQMAAERPLPDGFEITPTPLRGRRVTVRDRPGGFQVVSARWPEDSLEAKRFPMVACSILGATDLVFGNYTMHCAEGRFILIESGIAHPDGKTPHLVEACRHTHSCDILWICPLGDVLKAWICRSENGRHISLPTVYLKRQDLCEYCEALFRDNADRGPVVRSIRRGLLIALFSSVLHEVQEGRYFRWLPQIGASVDEEESDPIKRAQAYVKQHISEQLTIDHVARYCYMSRSQFAKVFRTETGETFNQFLTNCRLEEAKLRLTTTTAQVAGIARHVGLKPRHFNELIREHTGMTPGMYRKQNRDEANSW